MGLLSNIVHGVLDVAGFIPGVGAVADLANAAIYAAEGDWGNAAMSAVSAIPGIGDTMAFASKGAKVAKGLKGLSALGKGKALLKGMKGKLLKSLKGLAKDGASFLKKLNPKKLFKGIKKEKKKVCVSHKCFTEDTLVCTPDGYVMIRDIKEGDIVCSKDEFTGETGYKKVTSISRTEAHTIYTIKVDGDAEIKATAYHPFYVKERGWVNAINLSEGDRLVTEEGTSIITSISKERHEEPVIMYNFHVEDWVSYFVSELKVYVHNGGKHPNSVSKGASGAKGPKFSETFNNWDDMKNAHKGTVTQFVKDNKPLGSTHPRDWLKNGGSLTIDTLDDGTQIWKYTKDGITVPYVPKMVNGKMENVVKFPNEYLYTKKNFDGSFKVPEGFTGNRTLDKANALKYLEGKYGISEIPEGFILHHDIDNGVFQLVRNDVHGDFSHYGGHYYNK